MFCQQCGAELRVEAGFCAICGAAAPRPKLHIDQPEQGKPKQQPSTPAKQHKAASNEQFSSALPSGAMTSGGRAGSSLIGAQAKQFAIILFVFGLFMGGIDNYAHAGGFVGGYAAAIWLDPLKPERIDHLALAVACLGVTAAAIVASLVKVLPALV